MPSHPFLTTTQAALACGVTRNTALRWVKAGLLKSHKTSGGQNRILKDDLLAFLRELGVRCSDGQESETPRIAVVDDDDRMTRAIERIITQELPRVEVRVAHDGFAAGVLVGVFRPHVLFLDVVMPRSSGLDVCKEIRANKELNLVKIVIVSGHLDDELVTQLTQTGADRCLSKPFESKEIKAALLDYLPDSVLRVGGIHGSESVEHNATT